MSMPLAQPFPMQGLTTARLCIRPVSQADAPALLDFFQYNREHLRPWEPLRSPEFYQLTTIQALIRQYEQTMANGQSLNLLLLLNSPESAHTVQPLIGTCNFSNIVRGVFQACHLGYALSDTYQGAGLMQEALTAAIDWMFDHADLHRIMANYRPENLRSAALLKRLGFEQEGYAKAYLRINGIWADHILTALINPAHQQS